MIFKVGDSVFVTTREPMPISMRHSLMFPQVIKEICGLFYMFESGWTANIQMGDKLFPDRSSNERKV